MAGAAIAGRKPDAVPVRATPGLSPAAGLGLGCVLFLAFLLPALVNGLPLVFTDTQGYVLTARVFRPQHIRAFGYSAFILASGGLLTLWLTAAAQAAIAAWLATRMIALEARGWPERRRLPAVLALAAVLLMGHLPWLTSWLQPDVFAGIMLLALFLLAEHWRSMGWPERVVVFAVLSDSVTAHLTHPPLLAGLGLFAGVLALLHRRPAMARVRRAAAAALLAAALGWGMLATANLVTYKKVSASLGNSVFLFARLQADMDAAAVLRPGCEAGKPWAVCRVLDRLGLPADVFLWRNLQSPLPELGWPGGFWPEAAELNRILIRQGWRTWLGASATRTVEQMAALGVGDGMDGEGPWMLARDMGSYGMPDIAGAVSATRQASDGMRPLMPHTIAEGLSVAGLLALAGLVAWGWRRGRSDVWWPALALLAVFVGNAVLVGLGGEVHARYTARIVWLLPFAASLLLLRAWPSRR